MRRWLISLTLVNLLWTATAVAGSGGIRFGSLEFEVLEGNDPIGLVALLFLPDAVPSITYQIPQAPSRPFMTPWAITVGGGKVGNDTLIMLTNPDDLEPLKVKLKLRDATGVLADGCTRTLNLEPKATTMKTSSALFPNCPTAIP